MSIETQAFKQPPSALVNRLRIGQWRGNKGEYHLMLFPLSELCRKGIIKEGLELIFL